MLELLVAGLCFGHFRCDEASKAYFVYNPAPKLWANVQAKTMQKAVTETIGEQSVIAIATVAAAVSQKTYQVRVNKYFSVGIARNSFVTNSSQGPSILFGMEF